MQSFKCQRLAFLHGGTSCQRTRRCSVTQCMQHAALGATDVRVSRLGLGTMTFGESSPSLCV